MSHPLQCALVIRSAHVQAYVEMPDNIRNASGRLALLKARLPWDRQFGRQKKTCPRPLDSAAQMPTQGAARIAGASPSAPLLLLEASFMNSFRSQYRSWLPET